MPEKPLHIAVLISGGGSNLQAIIDRITDGELNAEIVAVISDQPQAYGLQRAQQAGIPHEVVQKEKGQSRQSFDKALASTISSYQPELIVLAGFMRILSADFVEKFAGKIINLHPSLLPAYKGLNTHQRVLGNQEEYHGATVHYVTAKLDDGPVIIQEQLAILPEDTAESLQQRVLEIEHRILPLAIAGIADSS